MGAQDRRARILSRVDEAGVVRASELAEAFQVSEMTVRRDLDELAAEHRLVRMRGGAARIDKLGAASWDDAAKPAIGIVFPSAEHIYPSVFASVERVLKESTASVRLLFSHYNAQLERSLVDELVDNGIDGLLFTPSIDEEAPDLEYLGWLTDLSVPLVLVERRLLETWPAPPLPSVRVAFEAGLATAVRHLSEFGHRRIAFFGHLARLDLTVMRRQWSELVTGFGLESTGSPFLVDRDFRHWQSNAEPERIIEQVRAAGATALICRDDSVALTMAHHLRRLGVAIPDDLSMVAYDDGVASMCDPPLTAIAPPKEELGRVASQMLLELIRNRRADSEAPIAHLELEPSLVIRSSTADPPH